MAPPNSVVVLNNLIQNDMQIGKVDEKTRIPVETSENIRKDEQRWLCRIDGAGVRPMVRYANNFYERRYVYANYGGHNNVFGVAYVGSEAAASLVEVLKEKLATVADPQQLKQYIAQIKQAAEYLQKEFEGWDHILIEELINPIFEKVACLTEVANTIEHAGKVSSK
ncbi:MAG: hypothetical protein AB1391_02265 [Candidatus Micrarchaeota archaeon]